MSFTPEWISGYPADKSDERMMLASDLALKFDPIYSKMALFGGIRALRAVYRYSNLGVLTDGPEMLTNISSSI